jgi:hypothetical protein
VWVRLPPSPLGSRLVERDLGVFGLEDFRPPRPTWTRQAEDRLTSLDDLRACVLLDGPLAPQPNENYVVSLDLRLTHDRTVGVVAHAEPHTWMSGRAEDMEALGPTLGNWYEPDPVKRFALEQARQELRRNPRAGQRVVLDRMEVWQGSKAKTVELADVEEWPCRRRHRFGPLSSSTPGRRPAWRSDCPTAAGVSRSSPSRPPRSDASPRRCTCCCVTVPWRCPTTPICSTSWPTCVCARRPPGRECRLAR